MQIELNEPNSIVIYMWTNWPNFARSLVPDVFPNISWHSHKTLTQIAFCPFMRRVTYYLARISSYQITVELSQFVQMLRMGTRRGRFRRRFKNTISKDAHRRAIRRCITIHFARMRRTYAHCDVPSSSLRNIAANFRADKETFYTWP